MKAVLHTKFGPPDELQLGEVEKPIPKENEVLIKIHATTVTTSDCNIRNSTFTPAWAVLPMRLFVLGAFKPRNKILGTDLAGEIEAVGKNVKRFREGDPVFGTSEPAFGTHAEYICVPEDGVLDVKPANLTFTEAAAVPNGAFTALTFTRNLANIQSGQKVLINGASGMVGTFAVQLAKHYGADITGVCSTTNLEMVKALGADQVIDYTQEDFTRNGETYDVIFDVASKLSFSRCKSSIKQGGLYLATVPSMATMILTLWTSRAGSKKVKSGAAEVSVENIVFLKELIEAGKITPIIDRCYPLEQTAEAFRYVEKGHKQGNVVIRVINEN
ncbi:MAG: NAD(P)-dependent alcohol dehydrogenase [Anaerolineae bacterium]